MNEKSSAIFGGLDAGSRFVKLAIGDLDSPTPPSDYPGGAVLSAAGIRPGGILRGLALYMVDTALFYRSWLLRKEGQGPVLSPEMLSLLGCQPLAGPYSENPSFSPEKPSLFIVATGYGRNTVGFAGVMRINEIKAHSRGAATLTNLDRFLMVDIGGQDTKVVDVAGGRPIDFLTNDKCAAGSGRYIEHMAAVLGVPIGEVASQTADPVRLSSTCAIFAESEVIGCMASGLPVERIMAGVNLSVAERVAPLVERLRRNHEAIVLVGGVASFPGVGHFLGKITGMNVLTPAGGAYTGALGCVCMAAEIASAS